EGGGDLVAGRSVALRSSGRGKTLRLRVTDVGLGRVHVVPVRGDLQPLWLHRGQVSTGRTLAGLLQETLDGALRLLVPALAELVVTDPSLAVDEVEGWPDLVLEGAPDEEVVVDRDGVVDSQGRCGPADVLQLVLEGELRRVDANDHQALRAVSLRPRPNVRERAQPVDAGVGPDVDEHDLPPESFG